MSCNRLDAPVAVMGLALLLHSLAAYSADAHQTVKNTERVRASVTVRKGYIEALQLAGNDFRNVLGTLLDEGFRCSVEDGKAELLRPEERVSAMLECRREGTKINKVCELMIVGVVAADERIDTRSQLLRDFSRVKAGDVVVFCAEMPKATLNPRAPFERNRQTTENKVAERMEHLDVAGKTGAVALLELLERGYTCGVESQSLSGKKAQPQRMICDAPRTSIPNCLRERVVLELEGNADPGGGAMDDLGKVVVRSQKSSCGLAD